MRHMYSRKATTGFIVITLILVAAFAYISYDANLFKGQLNLFSNKSLAIEYPTLIDGTLCEGAVNENCNAAEFFITSQFTAPNTSIIIKNPATQAIVAMYEVDLEPTVRTSVSFDGVSCGEYSLDLATSTYVKNAEITCPAGIYELIVSGNSVEQGLFAEAVTFALTK